LERTAEMNQQSEDDRLSELLGHVSLPVSDPREREAIFAQTLGVLRRRRWKRYSVWVAALASCYAIGVLSCLAWQSARQHSQLAAQSNAVREKEDSASSSKAGRLPDSIPVSPKPSRRQPASFQDEPTRPVAQTEPAAVALTTFEKLRRAGDRQLNDRGNLQGAIGCYRRALDFASDDDLQIVPERDSWLLIPLKEARLEIRKHVHKKS
jgi:hypothetical protein